MGDNANIRPYVMCRMRWINKKNQIEIHEIVLLAPLWDWSRRFFVTEIDKLVIVPLYRIGSQKYEIRAQKFATLG